MPHAMYLSLDYENELKDFDSKDSQKILVKIFQENIQRLFIVDFCSTNPV